MTRSANDIAVAIAEAVGGSESNFADLMTRRAHELGMSNTLYRNASGLPNDEQVTTARDLTILGRSLEERFPRYFRYFSTAQSFDGEIIGNHNHLLGRIDGVDGIKTGYTRASGFNLLTSVHRNGRSLLAVVMGGRSAAGRDRIMANLIEDHIAEASTSHTATSVADASFAPANEQAMAPSTRARPALVAQAKFERASAATRAANAAGEGDDGAGDEEIPTLQPMLKAPESAPRPAQPTAADLGLLKNPAKPSKFRPGQPGTLVMPPDRSQKPADDQRPGRASAKDDNADDASAQGVIVDRRPRQPRQGERPFEPRAGTQPFDPRFGQAGHREGAQRQRHALPRTFRGPGFSLSRSRVPLAQADRFLVLHRPRLTRTISELLSLDAASEHPWPD